MTQPKLTLTETQLRAFRARRGHLAGPGAADPVACARDLLGAQAQVESCALHALSLRSATRPTASDLQRLMWTDHTLVRAWGQRGTLHLYAQDDLAWINGARATWGTSGRRGAMPSEALIAEFKALFVEAGEPLCRTDLLEHIPSSYVEQLKDHPGAGKDPRRFAASRLIWVLSRRGELVHADKKGREQGYAHRDAWCPDLPWREIPADEANAQLAKRYLRAFGPATLRDVAYHFGAKISDVRRWSALIQDDVVPCVCGARKNLLLLREDVDAVREPLDDWPVRLMPAYDTVLMGHKDKGVILPDASEEPLIWKRAAVVAAVVLAEGRIVATWSHNKRAREVDVVVSPLSGWDPALLPGVEAEAQAFAAHVESALGDLSVA